MWKSNWIERKLQNCWPYIGHLNFNTNNSKSYINSIQQRIQDQAKQNMNSLFYVCEKLKFFREIHESGERPPYIDICKLKSDRSLLSKFRLSGHSLAIEKGRYSKIERHNCVLPVMWYGRSWERISFLFNLSTLYIFKKNILTKS